MLHNINFKEKLLQAPQVQFQISHKWKSKLAVKNLKNKIQFPLKQKRTLE